MNTPIVTYHRGESTIDFPGHLSRLMFTSGCNFTCSYCHNYTLWKKKSRTLSYPDLEKVLEEARKNWIDAICITGGEPTIHPELPGTIQFIRDQGFRVKLDTNGSNPRMLKELLPLLDYVAMDYKAPLKRYPEIINRPLDLTRISRSRDLLISGSLEYEFRTTVIPAFHKPGVIRTMATELRGARRYFLQAFVPKSELLNNDYTRVQRTTRALLEQNLAIARAELPRSEIKIR